MARSAGARPAHWEPKAVTGAQVRKTVAKSPKAPSGSMKKNCARKGTASTECDQSEAPEMGGTGGQVPEKGPSPPAENRIRATQTERAPARANVRKRRVMEGAPQKRTGKNSKVMFEPPLTSASTVSR